MRPIVKALFALVEQMTVGAATQLHTDTDGNLWVTGSGLQTEPHPRSDAVDYLTDAQLPDGGESTDVQVGAVPVPSWATSAMIFVEYEANTDPSASGGYGSYQVYVGPSLPGTLVLLGSSSAIGTSTAMASVASDIGGAATIGLACHEENDVSYPGKVTIKIVFH